MERHHQALRRSDVQEVMQQAQLNPAAAAASSPCHEFSFTVSLPHSGPAPMKITGKNNRSPLAVDLSPADEIFFHGHLLPLHLLSHLPASPRLSTNSLDSFSLPIDELSQHNSDDSNSNSNNNVTTNDDHDKYINMNHHRCDKENAIPGGKWRRKLRFLSLFSLARWRKTRKKDHQDKDEENKSKFDIRQAVKRYMRLVKPTFLAFTNRRGNARLQRRHQPHSFSGNLMLRSKQEPRGRRAEYSSAPASMTPSRTNSGLLVASGSVTPTKSDSTMEELQAAIQAAIAHCKNTLAADDHQIKLQ